MRTLKKFDLSWIGFAGLALGALATAISNEAQRRQMDQMIDEKVREVISEQEKEEETE